MIGWNPALIRKLWMRPDRGLDPEFLERGQLAFRQQRVVEVRERAFGAAACAAKISLGASRSAGCRRASCVRRDADFVDGAGAETMVRAPSGDGDHLQYCRPRPRR